ncbi:Uncharacterized protein FWK35_00028908 [Aphis craccivora]|uniref:Uncharacterized protein n=1 Tax=Aphis craccivora TaxID=307492 RepID=A0A6G0VYS6_APHCR|nr:Uncharacterized protein FWK35_00028908 [Aphis craccivora]
MISAILDVHYIIGVNGEYFIKEMSVIDIESSFNQHWIFRHTSLKHDTRSLSVNSYLQQFHHGLSGIYVKGRCKRRIIADFMPRAVVLNLEDFECPRICRLTRGETLPCCGFHSDFNPQQCTLNKVFAMKKWYKYCSTIRSILLILTLNTNHRSTARGTALSLTERHGHSRNGTVAH